MTTSCVLRGSVFLHLVAGNLFGGIETLLLTLHELQPSRFGLDFAYAICFDGRLRRELEAKGAIVHRLDPVRLRNPFSLWRARRALWSLVRTGQVRALVSHSVWTQVVFGPVARRAGLPLVFWQHDLADGQHWLQRWARRTRPTAVIANSRFTAESSRWLYAGLVPEVIYCPVAPRFVDCSEAARRRVRDSVGAPADATVIIQVSRLERLKGHLTLVSALGRLVALPGWICWIIGGVQRPHEQGYLEQIKRLAMELGLEDRVSFLGQRTDVPALLAAADIHCQPNQGPESFGLAFVEAMMAGLPVVTTDIGAAGEVVDAACGLLVPPDNPAALADALRSLIENPNLRDQLGGCGPARARDLCDPERQMARLRDVLTRFSNGAAHSAGRDQA